MVTTGLMEMCLQRSVSTEDEIGIEESRGNQLFVVQTIKVIFLEEFSVLVSPYRK